MHRVIRMPALGAHQKGGGTWTFCEYLTFLKCPLTLPINLSSVAYLLVSTYVLNLILDLDYLTISTYISTLIALLLL